MTDVQDIFKAHVEASQRRDELLAEAAKLNAAGKKREAAKVLAQAEEIHARLHELEAEIKG